MLDIHYGESLEDNLNRLRKETLKMNLNFTQARELTPEIEAAIDDAFEYHPWTPEQVKAGKAIREALANAVKAIVAGAPPSADRTVAIRKIREARMDANSAITHAGKY